MATDSRKLRPSEFCLLLNSTPLGQVITEPQLRRQRNQAGLRIGNAKHVDLVRYVAWMVQQRHMPKPKSPEVTADKQQIEEAARGAAASATRVLR